MFLSSEEAVGIDVDCEPERACRLNSGQPGAQKRLDIDAAARLDQIAPAVEAAHQMDGCRRRTQHMNALAIGRQRLQRAGKALGLMPIAARYDDGRELAIRRKLGTFTQALLLGKEA